MKLGLKKNTARGSGADLFAQCEQVYAASQDLAVEDTDGCAAYLLDLASPHGGSGYVLVIHDDPERSYGLFPSGKWAGHGSFMEPDGKFLRHGRITEADAARILATFTPAAHR